MITQSQRPHPLRSAKDGPPRSAHGAARELFRVTPCQLISVVSSPRVYQNCWKGEARALGLMIQAAQAGEFANTISSGLTPGAWLLAMGVAQTIDSSRHDKCGCSQ